VAQRGAGFSTWVLVTSARKRSIGQREAGLRKSEWPEPRNADLGKAVRIGERDACVASVLGNCECHENP
jgi:hypothetical protein